MSVINPHNVTSEFSEGMAHILIGDKFGFINEEGEIVIPAQYENVGDFKEGLAWVTINKKDGFIDKKGNMVIPPIFDVTWSFYEECIDVEEDIKILATVKTQNPNSVGSYAYIDKELNYYDYRTLTRFDCESCVCYNDKLTVGLCCKLK